MFSISFTQPVAYKTVVQDKEFRYNFTDWQDAILTALADYFSYVLVDNKSIADRISNATHNKRGTDALLTMDTKYAAQRKVYTELVTHDINGETLLKGIYANTGRRFSVGLALRYMQLIEENFPDVVLLVQMTADGDFELVKWSSD